MREESEKEMNRKVFVEGFNKHTITSSVMKSTRCPDSVNAWLIRQDQGKTANEKQKMETTGNHATEAA
jgi:hypothetical protein